MCRHARYAVIWVLMSCHLEHLCGFAVCAAFRLKLLRSNPYHKKAHKNMIRASAARGPESQTVRKRLRDDPYKKRPPRRQRGNGGGLTAVPQAVMDIMAVAENVG